MSLDELATLTDEQLEELRIAAATEQEKRARMRQVPLDIAASAKRFVEDGGDPEEIRAALTDTLPTPDEST
ncbi:hypothetical protein [Pseudoclavibacter sp. RFBB5]|uniref:hypothetical protein n=1 Tax=Pseudoclavibacter sp. RFBB5 TaxID=2080574 RepID=UPI0011B02EC1|nr:hypothetical protein [Pseudoclavibacter sp. RFBB5]